MKERGGYGDQRRADVRPVVQPLNNGEPRRGIARFIGAIRAYSDQKFVEADMQRERQLASNFVREYATPDDFTEDTRGEEPLYVSRLPEDELSKISDERKHARSILGEMTPDELKHHYAIVRDVYSHRVAHDENESLPPGMRDDY